MTGVLRLSTSADKRRLDITRELGGDVIVDVDEEDLVARAMALTGGGFRAGLDLVFEASGNPKSVTQAVNMIRPGGKAILIGIHPGPAEVPTTDLVRWSKSIIGAYGYDAETWRRAIALLATGRVRAKPMITHRLPLTDAVAGFEAAVHREAAKVIFVPETEGLGAAYVSDS